MGHTEITESTERFSPGGEMFSVTQISRMTQIFLSPGGEKGGSHRNHGKHRKGFAGQVRDAGRG